MEKACRHPDSPAPTGRQNQQLKESWYGQLARFVAPIESTGVEKPHLLVRRGG